MTDRNAYMRDYMRAKRQKARAAKAASGNADTVNSVNTGLTEERIRAVIREELAGALKPLMELLTQLTVNTVNSRPVPETSGKPLDYRRPDLKQSADPRCQAANRDGSRCKSATQFVIRASDAQGRPAEFGTCPRHRANFHPHPSVTDPAK